MYASYSQACHRLHSHSHFVYRYIYPMYVCLSRMSAPALYNSDKVRPFPTSLTLSLLSTSTILAPGRFAPWVRPNSPSIPSSYSRVQNHSLIHHPFRDFHRRLLAGRVGSSIRECIFHIDQTINLDESLLHRAVAVTMTMMVSTANMTITAHRILIHHIAKIIPEGLDATNLLVCCFPNAEQMLRDAEGDWECNVLTL